MTFPTHAELNVALGQPAFIDPLEIPVLCKYAAMAQNQMVEIGAAWGGSAVLTLLSMQRYAHLTSIDAFVPDSVGGWTASEAACRTAVEAALAKFGQSERLKQWTLLPKTSDEAFMNWGHFLDYLFIDGDHSAKGVWNDFTSWSPAVHSGGVVLLHDSRRIPGAPNDPFPQGYEGPTELANYLRTNAREWRLVDEVFSLTCWEKQ